MTQFLVHFFPLLTIFLFVMAAIYFFLYINSIRKIEKHLESNRPMDWESLGKPSIFSGKYSEKNIKFMEFVDLENKSDVRDAQLTILWEKSRNTKKILSVVTWSAFATYVFTIFAVRFLLEKL